MCETLLVHAACDNPGPRTQGYWHRQCLGVPAAEGGIDPGRNGRGPQEARVPDFDKLMSDVSTTLETLAVFGGSCAAGMDALPASDPCERALKQYTALLFNEASGELQMGCGVDLAAEGCMSSNVLELMDELAGLIIAGECDTAAACAAAVNEGSGLAETGRTDPSVESGQGLENNTSTAVLRVASGPEVVLRSEVLPRSGARSTERPSGETGSVLAVRVFEPGIDAEAVAQKKSQPPATELDMIRGHLSLLAGGSAPDDAWDAARDALLTALSGGYDPELRLEMVKALAGKLDVAYDSLLVDHLRDIHQEAMDFEKKGVAQEAERILRQWEPSEE